MIDIYGISPAFLPWNCNNELGIDEFILWLLVWYLRHLYVALRYPCLIPISQNHPKLPLLSWMRHRTSINSSPFVNHSVYLFHPKCLLTFPSFKHGLIESDRWWNQILIQDKRIHIIFSRSRGVPINKQKLPSVRTPSPSVIIPSISIALMISSRVIVHPRVRINQLRRIRIRIRQNSTQLSSQGSRIYLIRQRDRKQHDIRAHRRDR